MARKDLTLCLILQLFMLELVSTFKAGPCPTYPTVSDFNKMKFAGTWYVAIEKQMPLQLCPKYTFTLESSSDFIFDIKSYMQVSPLLGIHVDGKATTPNPNTPGSMEWKFKFLDDLKFNWGSADILNNFLFNRNYDVSVLHTDYHNITIVTLCENYGFFHFLHPLFMTREKPTSAAMQSLLSLLQENSVGDSFDFDALAERSHFCTHDYEDVAQLTSNPTFPNELH